MLRTRTRPDWFSFRRFAAFTTASTALLMMLGIYTAATGSGLACSAQWPLCDNGLLPQTVPSFIEWFHRLVAMVIGFQILGTAAWAWKRNSKRSVKLSTTLALVVLPLQVSIGAVTVTLSGLVPNGYSVPTQAAHFVVALTIFGALTYGTLRAYDGHFRRSALERVNLALPAALALVGVAALLSRVWGVFSYGSTVQPLFVGSMLVTIATLVAALVWTTQASATQASLSRLRPLLVTALGLLVLIALLGRDLVAYTPLVRDINALLFGLTALVVAAATWLARRVNTAEQATTHGVSGD
ncbi:cytochrome oxidase assembly protein [Haloprofundus marisrubri]|uniref:Cytochrome oxidase assembly protein n=1 Tax=Haloprofundus marisrubri TaxID=1514971 RepID=A0A0W1R7E5_9EURY|nr:COX15/CtaA family protein [Haloprofundus marisrubri]KTG09510.1 cytochrome oxidase assembly protein [Haloprofundus marisrubri]